MIEVNVFEIKAKLSEYIRLVERGQSIVICRRNKPIAEQIMASTKENMVDTVIKDGFHPYDAVYGALPPDQSPPKP